MGFTLLAVLVLILAGSFYLRPLWNQGRSGKIKVGLIAIGVLFILAAATGRANGLFLLLGAVMTQVTRLLRFAPLLIRYLPFLRNAAATAGLGGAGAARGRESRIETAMLRMRLDHTSGQMHGEVLSGEFAARALDSLDVAELARLRAALASSDGEGLRLFEAWYARVHGGPSAGESDPGGSASGEQAMDVPGSSMSQSQALEVLGLQPGASREDIVAAHRSLIGKMHPDKGGSGYLATVINTARDRLLD